MSGKTKKIVIWSVVVVAVIGIFVYSGITSDPVYRFSRILKMEENLESFGKWEQQKKVGRQLFGGNGTGMSNEDISSYLSSHTVDDLFDTIYILGTYRYSSKSEVGKEYSYNLANFILRAIDTGLDMGLMEACTLDDIKANTGTYYKEHPDAEPQPEKRGTKSGQFNSGKGNEVVTKKVTDYTDVEYYGDYALGRDVNYHYDEGRYEWKNGVFYDEPASWSTETSINLYYRGKKMISCESLGYSLIYVFTDTSVYVFEFSDIGTRPNYSKVDGRIYFYNLDKVKLEEK